MRPILKKAQWDGRRFRRTRRLESCRSRSGPYVDRPISRPGRYVELTRNPDYWGARPARSDAAPHNLDEIRIEYFGDETAAFEAFKAGEINSNREFNVARWDSQYDFPACSPATW